MTEVEARIALNMVPGLGPVRLRKLLETFGSPEKVLLSGAAALRQVQGIGSEVAEAIAHWENHVDLSAELERIRTFGAHVVTPEDEEYPRHLRQIHNPPMLLYVWGTITPADHRSISIVGSRKTSHYGVESAKKLGYQLAYSGLTVVSGLARGIDTAAHQGALAAKGRTIAVIGSGLMDLYPPENAGLAEKIAASGAVVTEFPMTFPPSPQTFPYRNRIVAGWSEGLLVVEAGLNSGALITAGQALEQGRLVYAIPGQIDKPTAAGSNRLIQQGAKLVTGAGDILDDFGALFPEKPMGPPVASRLDQLTAEERAVLEAVEKDETPLDAIVSGSGQPIYKVTSTLLGLEMKRLVRQLPGQRFVRLA